MKQILSIFIVFILLGCPHHSRLCLAGTIVTADALHCQKESVKVIKEAKADYC